MRPPRRPAPRAVPVVDRTGQRVPRPQAAAAPGVAPSKRMPAVNGTPVAKDVAEQARFRSMGEQQRIEAAITAAVKHVRRQNTDDELRRMAETDFWRYVLDESLRNAQLIDNGSDPRIVLRGVSLTDLRRAWRAVRHLAPKSAAAVTRPKMPNNDPFWTFIKDLRIRQGGGE